MAAAGADLYISNMGTTARTPGMRRAGASAESGTEPHGFVLTDGSTGRDAGRTIASYNLFGESSDLPDVVHCETVAARSVLHDWEFRPHRHARLHQLLLLTHGGGTAHLEGRPWPLHARSLVNVPIGSVHAFRFERGTQGWVVTLAGEMLDEALAHAADLRRALARAAVVRARGRVGALVQMLATEFGERSYARAQVLRGLTATLLGLAARLVVAQVRAGAGEQAVSDEGKGVPTRPHPPAPPSPARRGATQAVPGRRRWRPGRRPPPTRRCWLASRR